MDPRRLCLRVTLLVFMALTFAAESTDAKGHLFKALAVEAPRKRVGAPDFAMPDLNGNKLSLRQLRGKVVFLNFWATWCVPCRVEMPSMERLYRAYKDKGLVILAINLNESPRVAGEFMRELRLSFPALLDEDGRVSSLYGVRGLPTTFLIGLSGEIVGRALGAREWDGPEARELIEDLLKRQPVPAQAEGK